MPDAYIPNNNTDSAFPHNPIEGTTYVHKTPYPHTPKATVYTSPLLHLNPGNSSQANIPSSSLNPTPPAQTAHSPN
jgi:hypothetical protein